MLAAPLRSHGPSSSRSSCSAAPAALLTCLLRDKRERRRPSCAAFCLGRRRRQSSARFMDLAARQRVSYQRAQGRYPRRPTEARKRSSAKKSRSPLGLVAPNRGSPIVPMTNASCPRLKSPLTGSGHFRQSSTTGVAGAVHSPAAVIAAVMAWNRAKVIRCTVRSSPLRGLHCSISLRSPFRIASLKG